MIPASNVLRVPAPLPPITPCSPTGCIPLLKVQGRLQQVRAVDRGPQKQPEDALLHADGHRAQPRPGASGGARKREALPKPKVGNGRPQASAETAGKGRS